MTQYTATDSQGREWWKAVTTAGGYNGMKIRALSMEEHKALEALATEAYTLLKDLAISDKVIDSAYEAITGRYNKLSYRYEGFSGWFAIRRMTTVRGNVRKIAGDDANITVQLTRIVKEMKAIAGTAPKF